MLYTRQFGVYFKDSIMARSPRKVLSPQESTMAKAGREQAKKANFVKIARKRVTKAIKAISLLENLSNRGSYSFTAKQAAQIVGALDKAVATVVSRFAATPEKQANTGFEFQDDSE